MTIVFYTTGHGFGHATRDLEIIGAIARRRADVRIIVRTTVPEWVFEASAHGSIVRKEVETDTGVVQIDSLRLDEDQTARRAAAFYETFDRRVEAETSALHAADASLVIGDIPPLAFAAAAAAGIPSVAVANFTWDWIYAAYPRFEALAPGVIGRIGSAYAAATLALRLPLYGGFATMRTIKDVPFVARHATHAPAVTRRLLHLEGERVVLASFGGHNLGLPYRDIARRNRCTIVVTDRETAGEPDAIETRTLRCFTSADLRARGLTYPDLVAASDVVVSKPGYGIVAECIANGASLLFTDRGRFAEQDVFVAGMPRLLRCRAISQEDLLAGRWDASIEALLAQPSPAERPRTDGADIAAQEILTLADRGQST